MSRLVVVYGPDGDARVDEQMRRLAADTDGARDRDVGYLEVRRQRDPASLQDLAGLGREDFAVLLIGLDRTEQQRWTEPVDAATIWAAIDAMPMRRRELRDRGRR
jgi:hypothetical protein